MGDTSDPPHPHALATQLADSCSAELSAVETTIRRLQKEAKDLRKAAGSLRTIATLIEQNRPGQALLDLKAAHLPQASTKESLDTSDPALAALRGQLDQEVDRHLDDFATEFSRSLADHDVIPDTGSRDPLFRFRKAFIDVELNRPERHAELRIRGLKREILGPDAAHLAERVASDLRRLFATERDMANFERQLHTTYLALIADSDKASPTVPLQELVRRLQRSDRGFRIDEFIVDLATLVDGQRVNPDGPRRFHLDHTRRPNEGFLLPGIEDRGYFGYLTYEQGDEPHEDRGSFTN